MKCLVKTCNCTSMLMTVELCYPCSKKIEHEFIKDFDTLAPYIDRIKELEAQLEQSNREILDKLNKAYFAGKQSAIDENEAIKKIS